MGLVDTRVCEHCGKAYGQVGSRGRGLRFCSRSCRTSWSNSTDQNPAKRADVRAKISAARKGKPTTSGPLPESQKRAISKALTGRVASDEWRANISAGLRRAGVRPPVLSGSANPKWRGGRTLLRQKDYTNPAYIAFRDGVLERDNYTCRDCGARSNLHAHHIEPWATHAELRYEIANGVTLCHGCHAARHRGSPPPRVVGPRTLADLESGQPEDA